MGELELHLEVRLSMNWRKSIWSHRPEPKDTDAAMYLFLTSSGTRISSARFYQHYNDVITKCNFQFLLGKSLDENYKSATNATVAKINMNSVRRACSTIAQDTHDEVLFELFVISWPTQK